ncbi:hypothetical protein OUZ56_032760 [Daphnia magna]|uniref:Regulatory protein zeste n=1 Tax=Daphnia magna TaxID=35525 RepID=A0ABQ9ZX11_9CRUS|nr:hypothetical protein OUZ56_032760 [Daphnia magna]
MGPKTDGLKEKVKRDVWSDHETDCLLDLYIEEKEMMEGDFNTLITKELKNETWKKITMSMIVEFPDSKVRTVEIIKKKWNNFSQSAKAAIANHKAGLTETGGGPSTGPLKPLYEKFWQHILGKTNPSIAGEKIRVSIDTEDQGDLANSEIVSQILHRQVRTTTEYDNSNSSSLENYKLSTMRVSFPNDDDDIYRHTSSPLHINESLVVPSTSDAAAVSSTSTAAAAAYKGKRLKTPTSTLTMRQTVKKAKYGVCVSSEAAAESRVVEQRLNTLKSIMEVRLLLGKRKKFHFGSHHTVCLPLLYSSQYIFIC